MPLLAYNGGFVVVLVPAERLCRHGRLHHRSSTTLVAVAVSSVLSMRLILLGPLGQVGHGVVGESGVPQVYCLI